MKGMRGAQVHSTSGAAREAALSAAAQAEAALMTAKEKAAQTASEVPPYTWEERFCFFACMGHNSRPPLFVAFLPLFDAFKGLLDIAKPQQSTACL